MGWASLACYTPADKATLMAALAAWDAGSCSPCATTYGPVGAWNVTAVTDFSELLMNLAYFDEDMTGWDTSRARSMKKMFSFCLKWWDCDGGGGFDGDDDVDTDAVGAGGTRFNGPIPFDTSRVTTMYFMFSRAERFNQPLDWDTASVVTMVRMFTHCIRRTRIEHGTFTNRTRARRLIERPAFAPRSSQPERVGQQHQRYAAVLAGRARGLAGAHALREGGQWERQAF